MDGNKAGTLICGIGVSLVTGVSTVEFNDNPLTKSQSVSEFWGQRWNRVVGGLLRVSYLYLLPIFDD